MALAEKKKGPRRNHAGTDPEHAPILRAFPVVSQSGFLGTGNLRQFPLQSAHLNRAGAVERKEQNKHRASGEHAFLHCPSTRPGLYPA